MAPIVHTQNMVNKLNLYLGSESIYIVDIGFPTMGNPMLRDPGAHFCFCKPFSLSYRVAPLSLLV